MIVCSEVRCSDCFEEFGDRDRYTVIKTDTSQSYTDEERQLSAHLFQVLVCANCAGWYRDVAEVKHEPLPARWSAGR